MSLQTYYKSFFSPKKLKYKYVAFTAYWDNRSVFARTSALGSFVRLYNVQLGRYSSIRDNSKVMNAEIGNYSVIAKECLIGLGVHPTNYLTCHSIFYKNSPWGFHPEWVKQINNLVRDTHIGNDVWIGARSMVMDGVSIGSGAIVAAGSVVTKDVPPFALVGGAPAKLIKYRFPPEVIKRLEEIQWWNLPDEKITEAVELFHTKNPTLEDINRYFPII